MYATRARQCSTMPITNVDILFLTPRIYTRVRRAIFHSVLFNTFPHISVSAYIACTLIRYSELNAASKSWIYREH